MFKHFNYWYVTIPLSAVVFFLYGYTRHHAVACRVRSRRSLSDATEFAIWVAVGALNVVLPLFESFAGILQLVWNIQGGQPDDLSDIAGVLLLTVVYAAVEFIGLVALCVVGDWLGLSRAKTKAREHRASCCKASRPVACRNCKLKHEPCPVGIDRTPVWEISLDEVKEKLAALEAEHSTLDSVLEGTDSGVGNLVAFTGEACKPSGGTQVIYLDVTARLTYGEQSPRRLTPPPPLKTNEHVVAVAEFSGTEREVLLHMLAMAGLQRMFDRDASFR